MFHHGIFKKCSETVSLTEGRAECMLTSHLALYWELSEHTRLQWSTVSFIKVQLLIFFQQSTLSGENSVLMMMTLMCIHSCPHLQWGINSLKGMKAYSRKYKDNILLPIKKWQSLSLWCYAVFQATMPKYTNLDSILKQIFFFYFPQLHFPRLTDQKMC